MKQDIVEKLKADLKILKSQTNELFDDEGNYICNIILDRDYRPAAAQIHPSHKEIPEHRQECIEMMYVYSGQIHYGFSDKKMVISEGEMVLLTPKTKHEIHCEDADAIAISLFVLPEFFDFVCKLPKDRNYISDFFLGMLRRCQIPQILHFRFTEEEKILNLMDNIVLSMVYHGNEDPSVLQLTLSLVFLEIINRPNSFCLCGSYDYKELLAQTTLRYLEGNYYDASLKNLAEVLNVDETVLGSIIEDKLRFSFFELQTRKRFQKAVQLLLETDLTIEEIAEKTGNTNLTLFYRQFKHKYGLTPYQFRKKNRNSDSIRL